MKTFYRISVEKDWVVCLYEHDTATLTKVNTNIRTIDLICNLTAPLLAGQLLYFIAYYLAGIILIFWILTSTTIELLLLNYLFKKIDRLQSKMIVTRYVLYFYFVTLKYSFVKPKSKLGSY